MTDTEILQWLVEHGCIDLAAITYHRIAANEGAREVRSRIAELEPNE